MADFIQGGVEVRWHRGCALVVVFFFLNIDKFRSSALEMNNTLRIRGTVDHSIENGRIISCATVLLGSTVDDPA